MASPSEEEAARADGAQVAKQVTVPRSIPGNLPYLTGSGSLKRVLDGIVNASRPDKFNADFLENILKMSGGSARATIPIMKKMGFLTSEGVPTELYAKFRTENGRAVAAHKALRNGFGEIFKRSEYAHSVDENKLKDIIIEVTGLKSNDQIVLAIKATFNVVKSYIPTGADLTVVDDDGNSFQENADGNQLFKARATPEVEKGLGLVYNINIVLPETSDVKVLNAIFRSIKENLLQ